MVGIGQLVGMGLVVCLIAFTVAAFDGGFGAYVRSLELARAGMGRVYKATGRLLEVSGAERAATRTT